MKKEKAKEKTAPSTHIFIPILMEEMSDSALKLMGILRKDMSMVVKDVRREMEEHKRAELFNTPVPLLLNSIAISMFFHMITEHCDNAGELTQHALGQYINMISYALMGAGQDLGIVEKGESLQ